MVVPRHLTERQRDLLEKFATDEDPNKTYKPPSPAKGWLDKVWDFIGSWTK